MNVPSLTTKTFRSGNSEAVRLPREVAYGREVELEVVRSGDVITLYPRRRSVQEMCDDLIRLPAPEPQAREPDIFPDRPKLLR